MEDVRNDFHVFTIVPVLSGGRPLTERKVVAVEQKTANQAVWDGLTEDEKNNMESLDVVDIRVLNGGEKAHLADWIARTFKGIA